MANPIKRDVSEYLGRDFGNWKVIGVPKEKLPFTAVIARCACGKIRTVYFRSLRIGDSTSCGCLRTLRVAKLKYRHGMANTPEYKTWKVMIQRCFNPAFVSFPNYGKRGITVSKEWKEDFVNFFRDVGPKPSPTHTIDRINVNGNYERGNVRWATRKEQCRNKTNNHLITYLNETLPVIAWAEKTNQRESDIRRHLKMGWDMERIMSWKNQASV